MPLFDVHAHLTHPRFADDRDAVIARAISAGVSTIISNGLNPHDNDAVMALAAAHAVVKPAVGLYPVDAVLSEMQALGIEYPRDAPAATAEDGIASVGKWIDAAIAVGEIGLDGHWVPEALWPRQERVFAELVELAIAHDKPVIVHTRKREQRALDVLRELGATRVDWHCFGGKVKLARRIADAGHHMSIPANARRNEAFTRMLEKLPRESILLETDCPYLSPEPGTRNEPAHVADTVVYAAELWGVATDEAEHQLFGNFETLFRVAP